MLPVLLQEPHHYHKRRGAAMHRIHEKNSFDPHALCCVWRLIKKTRTSPLFLTPVRAHTSSRGAPGATDESSTLNKKWAKCGKFHYSWHADMPSSRLPRGNTMKIQLASFCVLSSNVNNGRQPFNRPASLLTPNKTLQKESCPGSLSPAFKMLTLENACYWAADYGHAES